VTVAVPLDHGDLSRTADAPDVAPRRATAWWPLALAGVAVLALGVGLAIVDALPVGVVADDSFYVILARALASGEGYRYLNVPGHPAGTHFPPGYPALLALLSFVVPAFPDERRRVQGGERRLPRRGVGLRGAAAAHARRSRSAWSIGVGALTAVSVPLLILGNLVLSELCFLALALALLLALERLVDEPAPAWRVLALGVAIGVCTLVRTHGIVLVPAAADRARRAAPVARRRAADGGGDPHAAPWQLWVARHGGTLPSPLLGMYDSYRRGGCGGVRTLGVSMIPATIAKTTSETSTMLAVLFSPMRGGAAHTRRRSVRSPCSPPPRARGMAAHAVTLLFLAGYLAIVIVCRSRRRASCGRCGRCCSRSSPSAAGRRSASRPGVRRSGCVLAASFVWVTVGYAAYELRGIRGRWWSSIPRANTPRIATAVRWVGANTAPDELGAQRLRRRGLSLHRGGRRCR
jgi:hypothetical protein